MKYNEIIELCLKIIKSYNPVIHTIDSHSDLFCQKISDENLKVFLKQVFYGYNRYKEFLQAFNQAFFNANTSTTNRNDGLLYAIFTYLFVFRFHELPREELKNLVLSQDAVKMNVYLQFLFDSEKLNEYVRDSWCQIFDYNYIDDFVISGIDDKLVEIADLLAHISEKATGKKSELVESLKETNEEEEVKKNKFTPTEIKPFNLTKPKPKTIPEPIIIPKLEINTKIPEKIYKTNLNEIEERKKKNLEKTKELTNKKYLESKNQRFILKSEIRPTNIEKIRAQVNEEESKKLKFNAKYSQEIPKYDDQESKIRFNIAAIIKEEHKLKAKEKEQAQILKNLEINMRDSTEFKNWKLKNDEKEKIEELEHQQKKKIEMELAREAAAKAVEEKTIENKNLVSEMKEISKIKGIEREQKKQEDFQTKLGLKMIVLETKDNAIKEKQNLMLKNKEIHDQNKKEIEDLFAKKKEEDKEVLKKKEELIRKIRELSKQPKQRTKGFDPTETVGYGILEEMTLEQLREKLVEVKKDKEIERENRRLTNLKAKDQKILRLEQKVKFISQTREEIKKENEEKRREKKEFEENEKRKILEIREKSLMELNSKIINKKETKKREEDRLAKELHEIKLKRQYLNANQAKVEEKKWKALQEGAEREIKERQNEKLIDQEKVESVKYKERKLISKAAETFIQTKIEKMKDYDEQFAQANKENEELYKEDREEKNTKYNTIKEFEKDHSLNMASRDTYKQKISELSLSQAKSKLKTNLQNSKNNKQNIQLPPSRFDN